MGASGFTGDRGAGTIPPQPRAAATTRTKRPYARTGQRQVASPLPAVLGGCTTVRAGRLQRTGDLIAATTTSGGRSGALGNDLWSDDSSVMNDTQVVLGFMTCRARYRWPGRSQGPGGEALVGLSCCGRQTPGITSRVCQCHLPFFFTCAQAQIYSQSLFALLRRSDGPGCLVARSARTDLS